MVAKGRTVQYLCRSKVTRTEYSSTLYSKYGMHEHANASMHEHANANEAGVLSMKMRMRMKRQEQLLLLRK